MIDVILIDDESLAILELTEMLKTYPQIRIIDTARNAHEAKQKIDSLKPQLIFLDINMPEKSGFDLLGELDEVPHVIFVTAYDTYAINAFEVNALDYILKPINKDRLREAIGKVEKVLAQVPPEKPELSLEKRIFLKDGDSCFFVQIQEIFLIESVGNYARIYFGNNRPLIHKSLNYLETRLPASDFFRTDRQHIINVNYIKNIHPYFNSTLQVELISGKTIELSQRQSVKFKEMMSL